jgi:hypothetical protein
VVQAAQRRVQVRARLLETRMSEHVLHLMERPTRLEQSRTCLVTQIVKVQIELPVQRT